MKKLLILSLIALAFVYALNAQSPEKETGLSAITINALKAQTGFLASDWTEGRETGSKGEFLSADYIASMLQLYGVKPGGDYVMERDPLTRRVVRKRSYFQNFSLKTSSQGDIQEMSTTIMKNGAKKTVDFEYGIDFITSASSPGGTIEADVVFVGYGFIDTKSGYNDFAGKNVKDKIILRLSGLPKIEGDNLDAYALYMAARQKDTYAINNGATGIIELDPSNIDGSIWAPQADFLNNSPAESRPRRQRVRYSLPSDKISNFIPKTTITLKAAKAILDGSGIDIVKFAEGDTESAKSLKGFSSKIRIRTTVKSSFVRVRNVVGILEGTNVDEAIVLGAHYDHLGMYDGYIYNGADDNASGTVGVLTIAKAINATGVKPDKNIVFALWTGEEKGLLGSKYYASNPTVPLESIRINVNFDMISRYKSDDQPNSVTMMYSPACPELKDLTINHISTYKLDLIPEYLQTDNPPGGTDHRSFIDKGIPYLRYKPGHREEYHSPADEISTLDWDIMQKIVRLTFLNIWDMATTDW